MAVARQPRTLAFSQAACLQALLFTLTATAVLAAYDGSLFAWHPILMTLAFPLFSFSAANVMRSRGLGAHSRHVWLQMGAGVCAVGGVVVMYRVKESKGGERTSCNHAFWFYKSFLPSG